MAYTPRVKGSTKQVGQTRTQGDVSSTPSAKGSSGIYNRSASPGLSNYPADVGPNDINVKFAETGVGDASMQVNQMRQQSRSMKRGLPKVATTSNMNTKKNRYAKAGPTKQS